MNELFSSLSLAKIFSPRVFETPGLMGHKLLLKKLKKIINKEENHELNTL